MEILATSSLTMWAATDSIGSKSSIFCRRECACVRGRERGVVDEWLGARPRVHSHVPRVVGHIMQTRRTCVHTFILSQTFKCPFVHTQSCKYAICLCLCREEIYTVEWSEKWASRVTLGKQRREYASLLKIVITCGGGRRQQTLLDPPNGKFAIEK